MNHIFSSVNFIMYNNVMFIDLPDMVCFLPSAVARVPFAWTMSSARVTNPIFSSINVIMYNNVVFIDLPDKV